MSKILFIRAKRCDDCSPAESCDTCLQGFNAVGHVEQDAQTKWATFDLADEQANQEAVYSSIATNDPGVIYGFGHGNNDRFTAQHREDIWNTNSCDNLNGRMVYLLSCLTANSLGPMIMKKGALAYAGFNVEWTWIAETDTDNNFIYVDPYQDKYAKGFYESANELMIALSNGSSFIEAVQASIQKYNDWISYWYHDNPGDPSSQDCIMWLAHNRDGLVALTQCDYITNEADCTAAGCTWDGTSCHSIAQQKTLFNPAILIPIVFVVGIIYLAVKK